MLIGKKNKESYLDTTLIRSSYNQVLVIRSPKRRPPRMLQSCPHAPHNLKSFLPLRTLQWTVDRNTVSLGVHLVSVRSEKEGLGFGDEKELGGEEGERRVVQCDGGRYGVRLEVRDC